MKRLVMSSLVGLVVSQVVVSAYAGDAEALPILPFGPYIGIHGGAALPSGMSSDFNAGPVAGAQVGYRMGNVRVEGAFSYYSNAVKNDHSFKLRMTTVMANGYYDFNFGVPVVPFIGAGIGWVHAWRTNNAFTAGPESNEFAYQGIAGLRFLITSRVILGVDYRRLGWTDGDGNQNLIEGSLDYLF